MEIGILADRFSSQGVLARVDGAPDWFGPAIRGAIMHGTPVLALDEYVEYWRETWGPAELVWNRLQLLPIVTGLPQLEGGRVSLRASNRLFACSIIRVALTVRSPGGFAICMKALTPRDVSSDPEPMCLVGTRVSVDVIDGPRIDARICAAGVWTIDACTPDTVRYVAPPEAFRMEVERWRGAIGAESVLDPIQRTAWRVVDPTAPGDPTRWEAVPAEPPVWKAHRDEEGTTFRMVKHAELECVEKELISLLSTLGGVAMYGNDASGYTLEPNTEYPAAFVRIIEGHGTTSFIFANARGVPPPVFTGDLWVVTTTSDGVFMSLYKKRKDTVCVYGKALHADPPSLRPPESSDASWSSIPICHLERGDSIRFMCTATLGTGVHPRWACACGGVPVVRPTLHPGANAAVGGAAHLTNHLTTLPPRTGGWSAASLERPPHQIAFDPSAWTVRVEPVGQLSALEILAAAGLSLAEGFEALSESLEAAYEDRPPRLEFVE